MNTVVKPATMNKKAIINPSVEIRFLPFYSNYKGNVLNPIELAFQLEIGKRRPKTKQKYE